MADRFKPETKLSQWDALMLESLKAYGWPSDEPISRVQAGNLPTDDSKFHFDYTALTALVNGEASTFEQAVMNGYQIKYNTIRGIHSWVLVALQEEAELILEPENEAVIAHLSEADAQRLASVFSFGWSLSLHEETQDSDRSASYRVAPIRA
ncbi:hypothetical protein BK133_03760 [Paenibacillus sp. FSL H8-0548]|uniref:hypothetical protein n=1 Tax=Paenibacillus sp. FSL H8-0548 TaxID=1920422 RepID=UPI00096F2177|nr:hypothetical protein [Paenibacillus sp. FSL H8-0548]OMF37669.1 hypothetical protein BK133_03760 [Paenibacillus sp. FSL H8-0548]